MADPFSNVNDLISAGKTLTLLTPSDTLDITPTPKALLIGGTGGNISIDDIGGGATAAIFPVAAGSVFFAVRIKRLRSTGTTATPIYAVS